MVIVSNLRSQHGPAITPVADEELIRAVAERLWQTSGKMVRAALVLKGGVSLSLGWNSGRASRRD